MGTNTMQIPQVGNEAGTAICDARRVWPASFPCPWQVRSMFSISRSHRHQYADGEGQTSEGHDVMVAPSALNRITETKIDSGMETAMMTVGRQSPRKSRIMAAVRQAAVSPSRKTP